MKYITLYCLSALFLAACSSSNHTVAGSDSTINSDTLANISVNNNTPTISSLCFLRTEGKDSTSIELVIRGNKVSGQMNWMPYQKDSRKGSLEGTLKSNTIHATWSFMQEGMKDTLHLNFNLKNNELAQKPLKLNTQTGREQTDESAGYSVHYKSSTVLHK